LQKRDEAYFNANVRPILERKGKDGDVCVDWHATHTTFHGDNRAAIEVADPAHPADSLIPAQAHVAWHPEA
jgi:hypothetical protein